MQLFGLCFCCFVDFLLFSVWRSASFLFLLGWQHNAWRLATHTHIKTNGNQQINMVASRYQHKKVLAMITTETLNKTSLKQKFVHLIMANLAQGCNVNYNKQNRKDGYETEMQIGGKTVM
jgi:hypothetical protein